MAATSSRRPLLIDMETGDPDDVLTLLFAAALPDLELKAVTLTPGSREQVALVRWLLDQLGLQEVPIGAQEWPKHAAVACLQGRFYTSFGRARVPDAAVADAAALMAGCLMANPGAVLLTGAPLHNLGAAVQLGGFELDLWVAQGGFAGEGVVPPELQMDKFRGKFFERTWNFGGNPRAAAEALASEAITGRRLVSKNVCHRAVYDDAFHRQVQEAAASAQAGSRRQLALRMICDAMTSYMAGRREGKKLHDPMALAALIDPSAFTFAEVQMKQQQGKWGCKLAPRSETFITIDYNDAAAKATLLGLDAGEPASPPAPGEAPAPGPPSVAPEKPGKKGKGRSRHGG